MGPKLATVSLVLLTLFANSFQSQYSPSTPECPPYHNGSIAGNSCSREYTICVNGVAQAATCSEGYVFYEDGCIPIEQSPECQLADDTEEEPYDQFDCLSKLDGLYAMGCANQFVNCVAEQAYQMNCPADLVFNQKTQDCRESCDEDPEEDTTTTAPAAYSNEDDVEGGDEGSGDAEAEGYYEPQQTTEQPETIDFDCNGLEDGNYADGCSDVFYTCNNNIVFKRYCPQGTVFNPSQQACDYDCTEAVTTTTQSYVPTNADVPTTTESTTGYPEPTTAQDEPEYTTTQQDDSVTATTSEYQTTTPGFDDVVTTTTTTNAPIVCPEGQVQSFGMCSSRFNRCQNNTVRSKQCPVNTLFETSLALCVFDLPQCQPVTVPATPTYNNNGYVSYGPPSDTIVSPFDENVRLKPKFDRRRKYNHGPVRRPVYGNAPGYGSPLLENPFFIPRHHPRRSHGENRHHGKDRHRDHSRLHFGPVLDSPFSTNFRGRAALNDQFKDYRRPNMGKIEYGQARKVVGNKLFFMDDAFEGPKARFIQSTVQQVFPEARHSKKRLGPREDPDGYDDDKTFDAKDLFGATRRKRSASYGSQQSGYTQQYTQISARQAQVNRDCQQYNTPTFLTFGDCFDQFIFCSGNGLNRMAACPIGETFNKALRACSETCGVSTPVVTATVGSQTVDDNNWSTVTTGNDNWDDIVTTTAAPSSYESYTTQGPSNDQSYTTIQSTWNDQPTTTSAPVGDRCSSVPSGLFSLGCSQKYIQCSNGAAIVRSCGSSLYFNQAEQACAFRDQVPECGAEDTTTYSPVVTLPGEDATTAPYGTPSDDTTSTTQAPVGDRCAYVSSGLFSIGCSQKYIQCSSGAAIVRQCSASLYFNQESQTCIFRDQVPECQTTGDDTPYSQPGQDTTTTTSAYGYTNEQSYDDQVSSTQGYERTEEPSEDQPTTYAPSVAPYNPSVPEDQKDEPVDACTGLSDGSHGQGCSSSFIICSYGRLVNSITCPLGQGYDPSVQNCRTFSQIPAQACDQQETTTDSGLVQPLPYVTLEDVLSTTTTTTGYDDETTDSYINVPSEDDTTTVAYEENTPASESSEYTTPANDETTTNQIIDSYSRGDDSDEEEEIGYEQKCTVGTRASAGFCVREYLECTSAGFIKKSCKVGRLFDSHANKCVARIACGKEAIRDAIKDVIGTTTVSPSKLDGRCANVEGEGVFGLGPCSSRYVLCSYGAAKLQSCAANQVFSNIKLECVSRESTSECNPARNPPVKSYYNNNAQSAYCDGKPDGLYGNKRDCSAILQCFGGELFEHPSCPSNLAFNEVTGKCDYPQKVSGCENHGRTDGVCAEHGAFIADVDNCSVFYRCVWGRKVVMKCPSGTVFNPLLSVCDWPSAVPSCGASSTDSSSSYGGSSYDDVNSGY
uniref:Chitin-binding type-2 domain-containing protein n=1 Tax=Caenorhabditis tropicalis TaxID=1561998 RepID=A0A1I7UYL0_9PELO